MGKMIILLLNSYCIFGFLSRDLFSRNPYNAMLEFQQLREYLSMIIHQNVFDWIFRNVLDVLSIYSKIKIKMKVKSYQI